MIAKIIAAGRDREEALGRLHRALAQMTVLVRGGTTNKSFLLDLLWRDEVIAGRHRHRLARPAHRGRRAPADAATPTSALVAAALDAEQLLGPGRSGDVPRVGQPWPPAGRHRRSGATSSCDTAASPTASVSASLGPTRFEVELDGVTALVDVERLGRARSRLTIGRPDVRRRVVGAGQRPPRRGRRRGPPVLARRRRHRAGAGVGARGRRRRRRRRRRRGRRAPRDGRGDEDGDGVAGADRADGCATCSSPATCRSSPGAAVPHRAGRRRRRRARPASERGRSTWMRSAARRRASADEIVRAFVLGFDVEPARARGAGRQRRDHRRGAAAGDPRRVRRPVRALARASGPGRSTP